jgi:hypothetical protein
MVRRRWVLARSARLVVFPSEPPGRHAARASNATRERPGWGETDREREIGAQHSSLYLPRGACASMREMGGSLVPEVTRSDLTS